MLRDSRLVSPLSSHVIERTLREFDQGKNEHGQRLWTLLMFAFWQREQLGAA
jgi:hypothetical protein